MDEHCGPGFYGVGKELTSTFHAFLPLPPSSPIVCRSGRKMQAVYSRLHVIFGRWLETKSIPSWLCFSIIDVLVISRRNVPRFLDLTPEEVHCHSSRFALHQYRVTVDDPLLFSQKQHH